MSKRKINCFCQICVLWGESLNTSCLWVCPLQRLWLQKHFFWQLFWFQLGSSSKNPLSSHLFPTLGCALFYPAWLSSPWSFKELSRSRNWAGLKKPFFALPLLIRLIFNLDQFLAWVIREQRDSPDGHINAAELVFYPMGFKHWEEVVLEEGTCSCHWFKHSLLMAFSQSWDCRFLCTLLVLIYC